MRFLQRKLVSTLSAEYDVSIYSRTGDAGFFAQLLKSEISSPSGLGPRRRAEATINARGLAELEEKCRSRIITDAGPIVSDVAMPAPA